MAKVVSKQKTEEAKYREETRRLRSVINDIYEKANALSAEKNRIEEELNYLSEERLKAIRAVLEQDKKIDPEFLEELLTNLKKAQRHLEKLGTRHSRKELEKIEKEIIKRQSALEKFEVLRKNLEKQFGGELKDSCDKLNKINYRYYSKKKEEALTEQKNLEEDTERIHERLQELAKDIQEYESALRYEEKPKELFKWW